MINNCYTCKNKDICKYKDSYRSIFENLNQIMVGNEDAKVFGLSCKYFGTWNGAISYYTIQQSGQTNTQE